MRWVKYFLCPKCGLLSNTVLLYEKQIWSYRYYVDTGNVENEHFEKTTTQIYRCPYCGKSLDLNYHIIEVNEENGIFRIPEGSYWAEDVEATNMLMTRRYGYMPKDWWSGDDEEEDIDDIEGKDIFEDQTEVWEV